MNWPEYLCLVIGVLLAVDGVVALVRSARAPVSTITSSSTAAFRRGERIKVADTEFVVVEVLNSCTMRVRRTVDTYCVAFWRRHRR